MYSEGKEVINLRKYLPWAAGVFLVLVFVIVFLVMQSRVTEAQNLLEASYQKGFFNLLEQVNNLNLLLSKSMVTSSNQQRIVTFLSIWHQAESARDSIASLPLGDRDLTYTQKYFAQMGDFAYSLAKKALNGIEIKKEEWDKIQKFRDTTQDLNKKLRELQDDVARGRINWEGKRFALGIGKNLNVGMADKFLKLDQKLKEEAPSITYDGPFSDHVENIVPKGLTGPLINSDEAIKIAGSFIDNPQNIKYDISIYGTAKGNIPAYSLSFSRPEQNSPAIIMDVSQKGGHVIWFLNTRDIGASKLTVQDAVNKSRLFLEKRGFKDFEATGSLTEDGTCVITFAKKQKDVIIYPDFIKVEVALDNGEVVGFDAIGYYTNHMERVIPAPKLSKKDVLKRINSRLSVKRIRKVIIPDPSLKEKFCYEVDAKLGADRYFIYINALDGTEEQILKVVETEKGTMTM